ncbi:MAG: 23S rRNA (uracil(1939)-C(5))-methyltransferase RlmD [Candidatus Zixiibacteriota bacterium]|nr:MAG: 23S rRNA (uracil(1939)-C(5))-methyltransferase RlmD [candidate division Zixibacteria bacterium]
MYNSRPKRKTFEIEVSDLAYDGKAVGNINGKIVFLDRGLPGEKVEAYLVKRKARFDIGRVENILTRSPDRAEARCGHFDVCGGCSWQDLDYGRQLYFKRKQIGDCLKHFGGLDAVEVSEAVGSEEQFQYRNKMEFSINRDEQCGFVVGLHRRGHYDEIFDLRQCLLQSPIANEIVHWFREYVRVHGIPVYDVTDRTGFIRFLVIREAHGTGQIMLNLVTAAGIFPDQGSLVAEATSLFKRIATIVQNINSGQSNIARGEHEIVLFGDGHIVERILNFKFRIYANSFFQTNTAQAERLYRTVFDILQPQTDDRLLDLYCGTGTIGICAASLVNDVIGIEVEPTAIRAAEENARLNSVENIRFFAASVEDFLRECTGMPGDRNCAIVDPPRAGLHPKALKRLMALKLPRLVFVSCNPVTFARDAAALVGEGYKISRVIPVDMFPHTMHIELVAGFYR